MGSVNSAAASVCSILHRLGLVAVRTRSDC